MRPGVGLLLAASGELAHPRGGLTPVSGQIASGVIGRRRVCEVFLAQLEDEIGEGFQE